MEKYARWYISSAVRLIDENATRIIWPGASTVRPDMKVLNLVLAVAFVVFAFLQINDPDPVIWILIYGTMAVACVLAAFGYFYTKVLAVVLILFLIYSFVFFPGVSEWFRSEDKSMLFDDIAKMQYPYIEESREFLGLLICILVIIMHLGTASRRTRRV